MANKIATRSIPTHESIGNFLSHLGLLSIPPFCSWHFFASSLTSVPFNFDACCTILYFFSDPFFLLGSFCQFRDPQPVKPEGGRRHHH